MNKKGFTLIEILAIVVLIGVIAVIAIPNITKQAEEHTGKQNKLTEEKLLNAAKIYASMDIKINESTYKIDNSQSSNIEKLINCANGRTCLTMLIYSEDSEKDTLVKRELLAFSESEIEAYKDNYVIVVRKEGTKLIYDIPKIYNTGSSPAITTSPSVSVTTTKKDTSDDTASAITKQEALLLTADAFFKQGKQVQYDTYKRNLKCTPEDATSKHYCYVNCSGFVHMVHKYALGLDIPSITTELFEYANKNKENINNTVIDYAVDLKEYYSGSEDYYKNLLARFINENIKKIKPGDVIVWKSSSGHTMLVEKVDVDAHKIHVVQAGGGAAEDEGRYDISHGIDVTEETGAFSKQIINTNSGTATIGDTIIFNGKEEVKLNDGYKEISRKQVAILRFSTTSDDANITEASNIRNEFKDIYIAKVANKDHLNIDKEEKKITYTLKIRNDSSEDYKNLVIKENIDESKVSIVSNSIRLIENNGNEKTENSLEIGPITLKRQEEITLKYTVEIEADVSPGDVIISTGLVGKKKKDEVYGIETSRIETLVSRGLTDALQTKLKNEFFAKLETNPQDTSSRKFIKELYKNLNNKNSSITLDILGTNDNIIEFNKIQNNSTKLLVNYTNVINTNIKNYIYSNYYGLEIADKSISAKNLARAHGAWNQNTNYELYDRARTLTYNMLENGDVILTKTNSTTCYINNEKKNCNEMDADAYFDNENFCIEKTASDNSKLNKCAERKDDSEVCVEVGKEKKYKACTKVANSAYIYFNSKLYRYEYNKNYTKGGAVKNYVEISGESLDDFLNNLVGRNYIILRPYK